MNMARLVQYRAGYVDGLIGIFRKAATLFFDPKKGSQLLLDSHFFEIRIVKKEKKMWETTSG
jgi:hypothetical protein